jgi:hypothetical protein
VLPNDPINVCILLADIVYMYPFCAAGQRYGITLNDFARMLHGSGLSNYTAGMKRLGMYVQI